MNIKWRAAWQVYEGRAYDFMQQGLPAGPVLGGLAASRVLLEHTVRALLARQKPQVQLLSGCLVSGLVWSPDGASVQGALPRLFMK